MFFDYLSLAERGFFYLTQVATY
ncbi:hypothetical protein [Pseudanabaena sp. Chao 1811]